MPLYGILLSNHMLVFIDKMSYCSLTKLHHHLKGQLLFSYTGYYKARWYVVGGMWLAPLAVVDLWNLKLIIYSCLEGNEQLSFPRNENAHLSCVSVLGSAVVTLPACLDWLGFPL